MEDRIQFITYRDQPVLLVDLSNCSSAEMIELAHMVPAYAAEQPKESVHLLADFSGAKFDKASFESLKQATVLARPYLKRSAWAGTETLPKIFYKNLKAFSQRELPTFKTREEALEWLVADEKMASGQ